MARRTRHDREMESAMGGAGDATSGGGAGRGIPDADTVMRLERTIGAGDVEADRAKLFPDTVKGKAKRKGSATRPHGRLQGKTAGRARKTRQTSR